MDNLIEKEQNLLFQTYNRFPIEVERAEGTKIWDKNGTEYLDFLSGIAVNALGHSHKRIIEAAMRQIKKYMHISNYFYQEPQIALAEKLVAMTDFDRVFFSNSGTEAMEAAIKLIRKYNYGTNKTEIVAFTGGFHGRTYGALSIMDKPNYKDKMGPFLPDTKVIEHNNIDMLWQSIGEHTAGVVLEFVQGEGGIAEPSKDFVEALAKLKEQYGFLLVADEIQTGVGRTGKFFGYEHFDIKPDIVTMAKGVGGGMPLGALLAKEKFNEVWSKGNHGTTYGGNAVACACGLVVLEELENGLLDNVNEVGSYLKSKLVALQEKFPEMLLEVRGKGLMLGVLLSFEASLLVSTLLEENVISNAASGNVLRIIPPLVASKEDAELFIAKLAVSLMKIKN